MTQLFNITLDGFSNTLTWDDWFTDFVERTTDNSTLTVSKECMDTMIDEFLEDYMEVLREDLQRTLKPGALTVTGINHLEPLPEVDEDDEDEEVLWPVPTKWVGKTSVTVDDPRLVHLVRGLYEHLGEQLGANSNTRFTVTEFEPGTDVPPAESVLYGTIG